MKKRLKVVVDTNVIISSIWGGNPKLIINLWKKGEISGCEQIVHEILFDCDEDTILITVHQKGGACHTGYKSCFYRKLNVKQDSVDIVSRKIFHPEEKYGKKER